MKVMEVSEGEKLSPSYVDFVESYSGIIDGLDFKSPCGYLWGWIMASVSSSTSLRVRFELIFAHITNVQDSGISTKLQKKCTSSFQLIKYNTELILRKCLSSAESPGISYDII